MSHVLLFKFNPIEFDLAWNRPFFIKKKRKKKKRYMSKRPMTDLEIDTNKTLSQPSNIIFIAI